MAITEEKTVEEKNLSFVEQLVEQDLAEGKNAGRIQTRFPPEPNGYLHIGHAKAICMDFGVAEKYNGVCNLRFDDTNPTKENNEYVENILNDISWLGFKWGNIYYASDYFEKLWDFAVWMIKNGHAYIDEQTAEQIAEQKGTPTTPGVASPYRDRPVEESLKLFNKMNTPEAVEGSMVLRAKLDMANPNMHFRDPIIYRIIHTPHHRTGTKWHAYPMYDFAHGQSDFFEGVTHSICTLEFVPHRPLYDKFIDYLKEMRGETENLHDFRPRQIEFNRLNLTYTMMSKRKLLALVEEKFVSGWDDPRMPTLSGMRRRGYPAEAIRAFVDKIGVSKAYSVIDYALLESCVRDNLNENADRAMAVLRPLKIIIDNYPENKTEEIAIDVNPGKPEKGKRSVTFSREIFIEQDDFMLDPPGKYFRLCPAKEIRLKGAYYIKYASHETDENGNITAVHCTYDPESYGGETPDGRKVKGTLHWVSADNSVEAEVRLYERLFNVPNPSDEEGVSSFADNINPESLTVLEGCRIDKSLAGVKPGDTFQFMRQGYFCTDTDSTPERLVFNRTVALKDSFAKKA